MNFLLDPAVAIYVAMAVALVVWIAVFIFLMRVDAQARELRKKLAQLPAREQPDTPKATLEVRGRGSEIGGQASGVRDQGSGVGGQGT